VRKRALPKIPVRALVGLLVLFGIVVAWYATPRALRRIGFFRVRQIELVGVRYLSPDSVIAALHLRARASVFDDTGVLTTRVRRLDGVATATVVRRPPGALQVIVHEVPPVAFVTPPGGGALNVVDRSGQTLPYDPGRAALDLPIAASADSGVLGVLAVVQAVDLNLFERITGARVYRHGDVVLELGPRRVLLERDASPEIIRGVVQVAQDLAARGRAYTELDARYAGQVIVRAEAGKRAGA
jgi:cell division septal protein FtsQ